jgi:hypothetical protein
MADLPFPGYDTMTDAEVRREIAKRFNAALQPQLKLIKAAIAFEAAHNDAHPELVKKLEKEERMLKEQIDEGTQRWGGLDQG